MGACARRMPGPHAPPTRIEPLGGALDRAREELGPIQEIATALAESLPAPKAPARKSRRRRRKRKPAEPRLSAITGRKRCA